MPDPQQPNAALNQTTYQKKVLPLTGKWIPANEGTDLGANFKQLINLRYTDTHPVGIQGMTKINPGLMNDVYFRPRSAFHYIKSQPAESHLLVQAWDTGLTASQIIQNEAAIPGTGEFEAYPLWSDAAGADTGFFSIAPNESMVYCNSKENLIWGGDESRIGGFFISNPDSQVVYDYTERVQNTMTDAENLATMTTTGGGIDAYTKVVLHGENNTTDSSGIGHNFTASNLTYSTSTVRFGSYSFAFGGTSCLYCADHADFDLSGGTWSVDMWVYFSSFTTAPMIFSQATDANNYIGAYVNTSGVIVFTVYAASAQAVGVQTGIGAVALNRWHHIEVTENGNNYYIFVDGSLVGQNTSANRPANYTSYFSVGGLYNGSTWSNQLTGYIDEVRLSKGVARHTAAFAPQVSAYSSSSASTLYVVSTRPLSGVYLYVQNPNTAVAAVASDYWTGSGFTLSLSPVDYMEYATDAAAQAAYVTNDTSAAITLDYMEYSSDALAQAAYVPSAPGSGITQLDYMEYSTNEAINAAYVTDATVGNNIYAKSLTTDGSGFADYHSRQILSAANLTDGPTNRVRLVLQSASGAATPIDLMYIGRRDGSTYNMLTTGQAKVKVTFSGSDSVTVGANGTVYSDWIAFATNGTEDLLISFDYGAVAASPKILTSGGDNGIWIAATNGAALDAMPGGGTERTGYNYLVSALQTKALQAYPEATIKTQGSYGLRGFANTFALNYTLTHNLYCQTTSPIDLTGQGNVSFDLRSTRTGANIKIGLQQRYYPQDVNTKLLLHMDGSDNGTTFTDACGKTATVYGNSCTKTAQKKFGTASGYFDGNGDSVNFADCEDWNFGAGDFTIDFWVRMVGAGASGYNCFVANSGVAGNYGWGIQHDTGKLGFYYTTDGTNTLNIRPNWVPSYDTWYHVAACRSGSVLYLFVDGSLIGSGTITGSVFHSTTGLEIGNCGGWLAGSTYGYIDEFRVTKGRALWTAPFTVPAAAYAPTDLYTKLLLHCDGADSGTTFTDECGHAVTRQNALTKTGSKKFGTASLYCDGTDDYVYCADGADWAFGSSDFTIEFFINFSALVAGTWYGIMSQYGSTAGSMNFQIYKYNDGVFHCDFFVGASGYQITWSQAGYNTGQWYHFAWVRYGNDFKFYVDGTQVGSTVTQAGSCIDGNDVLLIGSAKASSGTIINFNGYMDEVRISKGIARYTTAFTAPTKAFNSTAVIETTPTVIAAGGFESKTWDISGTANADKNNIDGIILTIVNADADNTFYLDNMTYGLPLVLQSYSESTLKQQGSYSLKAVAAITDSEDEYLERTIGSPIDLTGVQTLKFDARASRVGVNFTLGIRDSGGTWTTTSPNILVADTWQTVTWDISAVADADKNAIDRIRLTVDNADVANTIYLDNFYAEGIPSSLLAYTEAAIKTQGSYALKGIALQTRSLNKTLTRTLPTPIDLSSVSSLAFDIYASRTGSNIKIGLHDSGGAWTEMTPNVTGAGAWQHVTWDISAVAAADRNVIDQVRITVLNADAGNTFYVDALGPAAGALSDGTATVGGTKTLGQSGLISFGTTTATAKPRMYNGLVGYLYRFTFTGISSGVTVSHATVAAPMQPIVDLWDGVDRVCMAFYAYKNSTYNDYTLNVFENEYDSNDASSFVELDSLATGTNRLYFASYERLMGINIGVIGGHVNTTAATAMTIKYSSDGTSFVTVGTIDDGTSVGGVSLGQSGTVTWNPPSAASEFMSKISKVTPRYHYEISFSQTLSADVQIFYVSGIPVQRTFGQYKFPLMAQDMLFLCCDMTGKKNSAIHSEYQTAQIFNGDNAGEIEFGETGELTCGASLYNLYGYNLYNLIIFFKHNEMWKLSGNFPDWQRHLVSETVGCPAPLTLKTIGLPGDVPQGLSRNVIVWQGSQGVYVSDGRAALPIHGDIECYFDEKRAECINPSLIGSSWAQIDMRKMEYHLHVASGSAAAAPDTELVFDLKRWRWYKVDRGAGKRLVCGASVSDTEGNYYNYGFIDTGYALRLENGTDFDGNDMVFTLETGDIVLNENDFTMETRVERLQLVTVANQVSLNDITYTHYVDTETTGTDYTLNPRAVNKRVANIVKPINSKVGVFHSGLFVMTTDNEVTGFEPLALAYLYSVQYEKVV